MKIVLAPQTLYLRVCHKSIYARIKCLYINLNCFLFQFSLSWLRCSSHFQPHLSKQCENIVIFSQSVTGYFHPFLKQRKRQTGSKPVSGASTPSDVPIGHLLFPPLYHIPEGGRSPQLPCVHGLTYVLESWYLHLCGFQCQRLIAACPCWEGVVRAEDPESLVCGCTAAVTQWECCDTASCEKFPCGQIPLPSSSFSHFLPPPLSPLAAWPAACCLLSSLVQASTTIDLWNLQDFTAPKEWAEMFENS